MGDARRMGRIAFTTISQCARLGAVMVLAILAFGLEIAAGETAGKGFPLRNSSPIPYSPATLNNVPYAAAPAAAQAAPNNNTTNQPAAVAAASVTGTAAYESSPLAFAGSENRRNRSNGESRSYSMPSIWPALLAVFAVCAVFVGILYLMKKYIPGHKQLFSHPAMELLGRTHLDQRRFVTLLRVGRRLVVVGVCAEEMRTLAEITDEAEITEIMEVARPKTEVGLTIFQRLFQRNVVQVEAEQTRAMADEKVLELDAQMSALRERVREIHDAEPEPEEPMERPPRRPRRRLDAVG